VTAPAPAPGAHGGDGARLAAALGIDPSEVLDLSASLNPLAPDVGAFAARHLDGLRRYPDARDATSALAAAMDVDPERLLLTNGGAEAIALVAEHVGAGWVEGPEFSLYARHLPALDPAAGRWRSNPNNPTGRLAAPTDRAAVWDEAFWPLAAGTWTRGDVDGGAIVVGSLTKLWSAPGLRLGYVLADPVTVKAVAARQPEWSVNGLAAAVVRALLDVTDLPAWRDGIAELRRRLADVLAGAGHAVVDTDAPWVLVEPAGDLRARLAAHAIAVRDCTSFGRPDTVRIAVPDDAGLTRLHHAIGGSS
jgi:histidinol-phosphate/aromatic aminotransferase/cobyric acid decarboxylase-like protein